MATSLSDLKSQIAAAEQAVHSADARAAESARLLKAHWRTRAPTIAIGAASAFIAWRLVRGRRHARALRATAPSSWARTLEPLLRYGGPKLATALTALIAGLVAKKSKKALVTGASVDLQRFCGNWYEIARLPEKWEKDCASDVTARYTATIDGGLRVIHQCRRRDGSLKRTIGRAEVTDAETNAKLRISYAPQLLDALPFVWSEYAIIDVAADYSSAIIGTSDREGLWLLARTPVVSEDVRSGFIAKALAQEFDTSRLIYTRHSQPSADDTAQPNAEVAQPSADVQPSGAQSTRTSPTDSDRIATPQPEPEK